MKRGGVKTGAWEEEENGVKLQVKHLRAQLAFFSSSVNGFHFLAPFITPHSYIHSTKNPEMLSLSPCPLVTLTSHSRPDINFDGIMSNLAS